MLFICDDNKVSHKKESRQNLALKYEIVLNRDFYKIKKITKIPFNNHGNPKNLTNYKVIA